MAGMDKKKGLLNVSVAVFFKIFMTVGALLTRRLLIQYIGNETNGLNSLYVSLAGFLAVAELGVGSAITFCMYRPIVEGDNEKVSALYHLFTRSYLIIGGIILAAGCALMPFLPYLAKDYETLEINLYLTFGLMLLSTVLSYMFGAKTSLINAYKNDYITTTIHSVGILIMDGLQVIVILLTKSFVGYLLCQIISILLQWLFTEMIARKRYGTILRGRGKIDKETRNQLINNIKAMFMHRIGALLVNSADSLIISAFIGVVILGKFSNYTTIAKSMIALLELLFTPLTSIIGHLYARNDIEEVRRYYNFFYGINYIIGVIFFLGYYGIIDNVVTLCFGPGLEMSKAVSFVITLNYFIQFMRKATLLFRDATGTFYFDRWKPLIEGLANVILSILFVNLFIRRFGSDFAVVGVIAATIITNLTISHVVEPYVLHKYALKISVRKFYIKNYFYILCFTIALIILSRSMVPVQNQVCELLENGLIAVGIGLFPCGILIFADRDFRYYLIKLLVKGKSNVISRKRG